MGAVTAFGWGVRPLLDGLRRGSTAIGSFDRFDPTPHRTHVAAQVPAPTAGIPSRRRSWADRFAMAAAREAIGGADRHPATAAPGTVGVFFGSSTGGMYEAEAYHDELCRRGRGRVSRLSSHQNSGPADAVARDLGITGPVETISSACASAAMALGSALDAVRSGTVEVALAGGADSLCRLTYAGFNSLRAVDAEPCRPFRADRAGLSLGEGGAVVVLEPLEAAVARRARPLAELVGYGASCDAYHMTAPDPEGRGAAEAILAALRDGGVSPDEIDLVNAHGTGTPHNDASEWRALRTVFGDRAREIPVTATKGHVGHLLGSSGAVEAVATLLGLHHGEVHPVAGPGDVDPTLPVLLVRGEPRRERVRAALSTSLGFGGANAALVFRRPPEDGR
jgi:3-oxoacyl-[acyl-carrier-protein] synthase II